MLGIASNISSERVMICRYAAALKLVLVVCFFLTTRESYMANTPSNHGKEWSAGDVKKLRQLAKQSLTTRVAAVKLGRTLASAAQKASVEGISFRRSQARRKK